MNPNIVENLPPLIVALFAVIERAQVAMGIIGPENSYIS
jgi:hypothetical protein